ncbi:protein ELC-like [Phoenix dactylifera]|uniref:Protein ELC-like n=1 Tax=Phoenix dactylifera TaxID=42345 RepID=A0A8B7BQE1_PHODC|nr:protein ELC-like [Phoenix dactylifera]
MADARELQRYLGAALSHRGGGALPYAADDRWLIRHHLVSLVDAFPSFRPSAAAFTYNDGRTTILLRAEGTIPTSGGHLPASIWLLEAYPHVPPAVFLCPVRGTLIRPGHAHVDPSGAVDAAYLRSWRYPASNLADLVPSLSLLFSLDPPLYTKPKPRNDPVEVKWILEMVQRDLAGREAEMEGFLRVQAELKRREQAIARGTRELEEARDNLEQELQVTQMNTDVMESWVRETKGNIRRRWKEREVSIDDVFEPSDVSSRKMMECAAMDLALEDTIYALDRAATEGCMPFHAYLKHVRALSREQFFHRSMAARVRMMLHREGERNQVGSL